MKKIKHKPVSSKTEKKQVSLLPEFLKEQRTRILLGIALALVSLYILFALIGFFFSGGIDQSLVDGPWGKIITNPEIEVSNPAGKIGAWISDLLINRWFGISSFILCYLLLLCSFRLGSIKVKNFSRRLFIGMCIILWISLFLGFLSESISNLFEVGTGYLFPGGGHGHFVSVWLNSLVGRIGTMLILILTFIAILFFGFERTFYKCVDYIKEQIRRHQEKALAALAEREARAAAAREEAQRQADAQQDPEDEDTTSDSDKENADEEQEDFPHDNDGTFQPEDTDFSSQPERLLAPKETTDQNPEAITLQQGFNRMSASINDFEFSQELSDLSDDRAKSSTDDEEEGDTDLPAGNDQDITLTISNKDQEETVDQNQPTEDYDPTLDLSNYQYPGLELLEEHSSGNPKVTQEELDANKNRIVETLRNYKIEITKIKATIGPTVTLYEIVPAPGVKISKIKNLEDDIALSLSALGIRIIAPIPGAGTIGIEVPNQNPEVVSMRGIIASKKFQESKYDLPIVLGKTITNEVFMFDLCKMPHVLVAGATGQGKSVGLNAIITSLLYKKHPAELKFVLVDPKKVEFSIYSVIENHFLAKLPDGGEPIITDVTKVVQTLNSVCVEMDTRYDLLKMAHVRNVREYNEKFINRRLNPEKGHKFMPYIVVVIDEFGDLIMTAGKEVELPIARIAQLARAVGIHMIIATQRPTTNIITGTIKANFPARIAFRVSAMMDSRTILDRPGANRLIGKGDMLFLQGADPVRVQCAFIDTPEVEEITKFIARQQGYPTPFFLPEYVSEDSNSEVGDIDMGRLDPLFEDAARLVVIHQQGSTSLIQRKFAIGYNRAGRIMDQLEKAGIVGPTQGSKARDVLCIDDNDLEMRLNNLQ